MSITAIILPILVQVGLTLFLLLWLGRSRVGIVRTGEVQVQDIALGERNWPKHVLQIQNSYHSQFELPVLFYVVMVLALITRKADMVFLLLAWMFVASRLVHAYIHTTSNRIVWRFNAFTVGVLILALMWVMFGLRIFYAEAGA